MLRLLDFGCGSGGFEEINYKNGCLQSWLNTRKGAECFGIDINPLRIELARKKINNGTHFKVMDGRKMDFPDNYFDIVHEWAVFHHMPDYQKGISEIHRVLKPGGTFLLCESVDNDYLFRICRRVFSKWHEDEVSTYFDSQKLDQSLNKYFNIESREYHWRFIPSDFLRQYQLEPRISLVVNEWISKMFNALKLGEKTCCHYVLKATKNN